MTSPEGASPTPPERAAAGARSTLRSQAVRFAVKIAGVVLLARLVSPAEHGTFAMAASVLVLLGLFRDAGTATAAIQAPDLSAGQIGALWRLQVALGVALAIATLAVIPAAQAFFHAPAVGPVLAAASASFVLAAAGTTPRVLLNRDLRFDVINRVETAGAVLGSVAMIGTAAAGGGAQAFTAFLLVSEAAITALAWRARPMPLGTPPDWAGLRRLLGPGAHLTGHQLLLQVTQQADTALLGRWFGAHVLGLYNRAGQLLLQPTTHLSAPLGHVLLATLSRLGPGHPGFAEELRASACLIAHLTLPVAVACAVLPDEIVGLALGPAWPGAAAFLPWLALGAAAGFLGATAFPACVAGGHARRLLPLGLVGLGVTSGAIMLGRPHGATGIAAAVALAQLLLLPWRLAWSIRGTSARRLDYAEALIGPVQVAATWAAGLLAGKALTATAAPPVRLGIALALGLAAVALLFACSPPRQREFRALRPRLPFGA